MCWSFDREIALRVVISSVATHSIETKAKTRQTEKCTSEIVLNGKYYYGYSEPKPRLIDAVEPRGTEEVGSVLISLRKIRFIEILIARNILFGYSVTHFRFCHYHSH